MSYLKFLPGEWVVCVCGGVRILLAGEAGEREPELGLGQWRGESCSFRAQRKLEFKTETWTKTVWERLGAA